MTTTRPSLLGEMLVSRQHIQQRDLEKALVAQKELGGRLGSILVRAGALSETNLLATLSEQLGLPILELDVALPTEDRLEEALKETGVSIEWMLLNEVILWKESHTFFCTMRDFLNPFTDEVLGEATNGKIEYALARSQTLDALISSLRMRLHSSKDSYYDEDDVQHLRELAEEAPVIELVNNMLSQAMEDRASDIHIEPEEDTFDIRYRIDGVMFTKRTLPKARYFAISSRLKLVSGMDISERRLPQDGRISMRANGRELDIRVSVLPGVHGESIVMRLLPKSRNDVDLEHLGLEPDHKRMLESWTHRPHGIVLVTGPTGSGKSTTLYSALQATNDGVKKIITVEDPVEFRLPHITQVQAHAEIGLTFASALRAILRQDPDVIMIGEIRDLETAEIAVQSALTGHLVLSTLHTNDAMSAFTRLIDMGVEPFLAATPVIAVQAQRLVRRLCPQCSEPFQPPAVYLETIRPWQKKLSLPEIPLWRKPIGCKACQGTGYYGRLGIYELVDVSEDIRELVISKAPLASLKEKARELGFRDFYTDGLIKAYKGITSIDEVHRVSSIHQ